MWSTKHNHHVSPCEVQIRQNVKCITVLHIYLSINSSHGKWLWSELWHVGRGLTLSPCIAVPIQILPTNCYIPWKEYYHLQAFLLRLITTSMHCNFRAAILTINSKTDMYNAIKRFIYRPCSHNMVSQIMAYQDYINSQAPREEVTAVLLLPSPSA